MSTPCTLFLLLALTSTYSLAQAQQIVSVEKGHQPRTERHGKIRDANDYVFMKDGVMLSLQAGSVIVMTSPIVLPSGTRILPDGTVTQPDGKQLMLHNGQYVLQDGRVVDESMMKGKHKD